jgi:hypothetical protein
VEETADLIRAFAALAWPLIVLVLLIVYKPDVVKLMNRLRRGKLLGQEIEFDLDKLEASATAALEQSADAPAALPPSEPPSPAEPDAPPKEEASRESKSPASPAPTTAEETEAAILDEAAISARLALISLSAQLERTMRLILASSQPAENWSAARFHR